MAEWDTQAVFDGEPGRARFMPQVVNAAVRGT